MKHIKDMSQRSSLTRDTTYMSRDHVKQSTLNGSSSREDLKKYMNPQTKRFLMKHFPNFEDEPISLRDFVSRVLIDYEGLWTADQAMRVQDEFMVKLSEVLGCKNIISMQKLTTCTRQGGIIGLILTVFRLLQYQEDQDVRHEQNVNNLKNILQEFVQDLYQSLEKELYEKFNLQMRRMVLKYKETEKMIRKLHEIINQNPDAMDFAKRIKDMQKKHEHIVNKMDQQIGSLNLELEKQDFIAQSLRKEVARLTNENEKLQARLERLQETVIAGCNKQGPLVGNVPLLPSQHLNHHSGQLPSQTTTPSKSRNLAFFVDQKNKISLGNGGWSRPRFSHPCRENDSLESNRLPLRA